MNNYLKDNLNIPPVYIQNDILMIDTTYYQDGIDCNLYNLFLENFHKIKDNDIIKINITTKKEIETFDTYLYSLMIADILSKYKNVIIEVPRYAFSGGNLIALLGNEIYFSSFTFIGTFDLRIFGISYKFAKESLYRISKENLNSFAELLIEYLNGYIVDADQNYKDKLMKILERRYTKETIEQLLVFFLRKYSSEYPIGIDELPKYLNIKMMEDVSKHFPDEEIQEVSKIETIPKQTPKIINQPKQNNRYKRKR
jgi:hypothetical protein